MWFSGLGGCTRQDKQSQKTAASCPAACGLCRVCEGHHMHASYTTGQLHKLREKAARSVQTQASQNAASTDFCTRLGIPDFHCVGGPALPRPAVFWGFAPPPPPPASVFDRLSNALSNAARGASGAASGAKGSAHASRKAKDPWWIAEGKRAVDKALGFIGMSGRTTTNVEEVPCGRRTRDLRAASLLANAGHSC